MFLLGVPRVPGARFRCEDRLLANGSSLYAECILTAGYEAYLQIGSEDQQGHHFEISPGRQGGEATVLEWQRADYY